MKSILLICKIIIALLALNTYADDSNKKELEYRDDIAYEISKP